ncbi:hypothetical protein [Floridanema aerugineum]|uniref:Uncharacterized protein n=1 Tax=Floridaenema aerugineum BLCC-F46 TaxID=3153654 RepID=A0ABV4X9L8_9CYAN
MAKPLKVILSVAQIVVVGWSLGDRQLSNGSSVVTLFIQYLPKMQLALWEGSLNFEL